MRYLKATSHSTILDIPMRPLREDQKHRHRFTRYRRPATPVTVIVSLNFARYKIAFRLHLREPGSVWNRYKILISINKHCVYGRSVLLSGTKWVKWVKVVQFGTVPFQGGTETV